MSSGDLPAVARHRVRSVLRAARQRKRITQRQVARALDWSLSKVQRIESGEVSVSGTDLRSLLDYLGVSDEDTVNRLLEDARTSRRERWYTDSEYREHLTPATRRMLQFESEATAIRAFHPTALPGLLQTAEYARAILSSAQGQLSKATRELRYEVRMRRKEVLSRDNPPEYLLLLDESVLWRDFGGVQVAVDQLVDLLTVTRRPRVQVRVLTFTQAAVVPLLGPFTIFDLEHDGSSVLYTENYFDDEVIEKTQEVEKHRTIFENLWHRSLDDAASERLILARATALLSSMDRHEE